jgi:phage N-6-adenine-methyltransferase
MSDFLIHIDKAKREIAAADSLVKIKDLWNKADAMRALGQAAKDPELINSATEFKLRCERRLGEMLSVMKGTGEIGHAHNKRCSGPMTTLSEMDIDRNLSSRAQKIAAVPEEQFEAAIATVREEEQQLTHRAFVSLIGESPSFNHRAQGTGDHEWYTPEQYIEAARDVLSEIDLDPASTYLAQQTVRARNFFTVESNGLEREWHGRVWLNPPYAQPLIYRFVEKLIAELKAERTKEAILLTHSYTDTAWFHLAAAQKPRICFTRGRIKFVDRDGKECAPTQGQAFFYYGENAERFGEVFRDFGFIT